MIKEMKPGDLDGGKRKRTMRKKYSLLDVVVRIIVVILLGAIGSGLWFGIEYGRYMYMAPDDMDFGTFIWIETLRR